MKLSPSVSNMKLCERDVLDSSLLLRLWGGFRFILKIKVKRTKKGDLNKNHHSVIFLQRISNHNHNRHNFKLPVTTFWRIFLNFKYVDSFFPKIRKIVLHFYLGYQKQPWFNLAGADNTCIVMDEFVVLFQKLRFVLSLSNS